MSDRFVSVTVRNNLNKDIEVLIGDGKINTGCWLAANRSKTEGFGPLRFDKKAIVSIKLPSEVVYKSEFEPDVKMIPRMDKYPELVIIVLKENEIKMGYTVTDVVKDRYYLQLDGETSNEFEKRKNNDDFVYYSGWGTLDQVKAAINNGAEINARNDFGMSGIMMAVSNKKIDNIKYILEMNPDLSFKNQNDEGIFDLAKDRPDVLKLINGTIKNQGRQSDSTVPSSLIR